MDSLRQTRLVGEGRMDGLRAGGVAGKRCRLLKPVRGRDGRSRFDEQPLIIRVINNLERMMYLVQFNDGSTTFLFPDEVTIADEIAMN
jgi:hypothetical protein